MVQWLLEMGARADILSLAGESPIDVARRFGQLAVLKALGVRDEDMPVSALSLKNIFQEITARKCKLYTCTALYDTVLLYYVQ